MTNLEAYDRACKNWGDGVAWELGGRFIVGRWIPMATPEGAFLVLHTDTKVVEVLGEGKSWEDAFDGAEDNYP